MTTKPKGQKSALAVPQPDPDGFSEIVALIATSGSKVPTAPSIPPPSSTLYWAGRRAPISRKIEAAGWGKGTVENLAPPVHRPFASRAARLLPTQPI